MKKIFAFIIIPVFMSCAVTSINKKFVEKFKRILKSKPIAIVLFKVMKIKK